MEYQFVANYTQVQKFSVQDLIKSLGSEKITQVYSLLKAQKDFS